MPRQKSIVTIIRDLVRTEIQKALSSLFGGLGVYTGAKAKTAKAKAVKPKNGRRRRRRPSAKATPGPKRGRPGTRKRGTSPASES